MWMKMLFVREEDVRAMLGEVRGAMVLVCCVLYCCAGECVTLRNRKVCFSTLRIRVESLGGFFCDSNLHLAELSSSRPCPAAAGPVPRLRSKVRGRKEILSRADASSLPSSCIRTSSCNNGFHPGLAERRQGRVGRPFCRRVRGPRYVHPHS